MAAEEYTTKIKVEADLQGANQTAAAYDKIAKKARELGQKGRAGAAEAENGVKSLAKSVGFLRKALSGFGVAGLFTGLIAGITKVRESFKAATKQAEEMAKIQKQLDESKSIQNLAAQYNQLKDSIAAANSAQTSKLDQIDTDVSNRRRLDKAKMEAAKQSELDALDPSAPDYAEQKAAIEAKYSAMGSMSDASNAREDLVLQRQRLGVQADAKDQEAAAEAKNAELIRAKINQEKIRRGNAQVASVDLNEADKGGVLDTAGKTIAQIFTGQWGRAAGATTAEGDAIRQQKAKEAADAELKIAELQEQLRKSEEKQAALKREAEDIRTKRDSMGVAIDAADIEAETARRKGDGAAAAAEAAIQKKRDEETEKIAQQEDAARAKQLLEAQKAETERLIAEQKRRKAEAQAAVGAAQGNVSMYQSAGDSRGAAAASAQLVTAQTAAAQIGSQADIMLKALNDNLSKINSLLSEANAVIKKNNSQRLTSQAQQLTFQ